MLCNVETSLLWQALFRIGGRNCRDQVNHTTDPRPTMSAQSDFDVFLTHNSKDKPTARELKRVLEARRLTVWFDEDQLS
jgi:hypothetical protein